MEKLIYHLSNCLNGEKILVNKVQYDYIKNNCVGLLDNCVLRSND